MIEGRVTRAGVPVISIAIKGQVYRAVIDTGFNGHLELPVQLRAHVNARYLGPATSYLAAGVTVKEELFDVDFSFDGHLLTVESTFVDHNEILIGTRLLKKYRLSINFVAGKVRLQKIA